MCGPLTGGGVARPPRPRNTLIGNSCQPVASGWPIPEAMQRLLRVVDTGAPDAFDLMLRIEGRPRVCSVKVMPFAGGLAIYAQDVTERRAD